MLRQLPEMEDLLNALGYQDPERAAEFRITGSDPIVPGPHRLGAAATAALGAQALGIASIWLARGGRRQRIEIDMQRAVVPGLNTVAAIRQNGHGVVLAYKSIGFFRTRDSRQIYLVGSKYRQHERYGILGVLECGNSAQALQQAVARWDADALERAFAERSLPVAAMARSAAEWRTHEQGKWLAAQPLVSLTRVASGEPVPFQPAVRPLSGVRVLDMSFATAGPIASRTLSEQGAEVLHLVPPERSYRLITNLDTDIGTRSSFTDLALAEDLERVKSLVRDADVFVQSWRPGSFERRGLSPNSLAQLRPGLVYVSISCYGNGGPWQPRGGYDEMAQAVSGIALEQGTPDAPRSTSTGSLTSYLTGYLAAAGALAALLRRAREGGSWHVEVSLARTAMWVQSLGAVEEARKGPLPDISPAHLANLRTPYGRLTFAAPIVQYSETPAYWEWAGEPVGASFPQWSS